MYAMHVRDSKMTKKTLGAVAASIMLAATLLMIVTLTARTVWSQGAAPVAASDRPADDAAINKIVAGFSDGWNNHDAQAMCSDLADDVQWVAWSGGAVNSRQAVVNMHLRAFSGDFKDTHRSDTVKSIHYLGPDLASVDDYWTMTGAKKGDGSDWPYRAGYVNFVMAKRNGRWLVSISHSADFNAQAPPAAKAR
jgi:uncharacterized protein (TIGR02246 family)